MRGHYVLVSHPMERSVDRHLTHIDTTTPSCKLTFTVLAAIAEFERSMISERVKTGMAAAKKRGRHLGRPHLAKAKAEKIRKLRESGLSFRKIASQVKVSVGTAVAYCK